MVFYFMFFLSSLCLSRKVKLYLWMKWDLFLFDVIRFWFLPLVSVVQLQGCHDLQSDNAKGWRCVALSTLATTIGCPRAKSVFGLSNQKHILENNLLDSFDLFLWLRHSVKDDLTLTARNARLEDNYANGFTTLPRVLEASLSLDRRISSKTRVCVFHQSMSF